MDQVGVKAPGRPTMTIVLPLQSVFNGTFSGGNPKSKLASGSVSPTWTPWEQANAAAQVNARKARLAMALPTR